MLVLDFCLEISYGPVGCNVNLGRELEVVVAERNDSHRELMRFRVGTNCQLQHNSLLRRDTAHTYICVFLIIYFFGVPITKAPCTVS
jgi:hypothetical protein